MISAIILSSKCDNFHAFVTVKNKSEIWFQYLVYYIIHTCNTHVNRYTAISTSGILNKSENATLQLSIFYEKVLDKKIFTKD